MRAMCVCVHVCIYPRSCAHRARAARRCWVLPASVPLFFCIGTHTYVSDTSLLVGNNLCAILLFLTTEPWPRVRRCASVCASLNLQNYTVDNLPDIQRPLSSAIRRGFFTAYGRTSASLSRWPRPGPFTHRCPQKVFEAGRRFTHFLKLSTADNFF